jgi:hypothetical protein
LIHGLGTFCCAVPRGAAGWARKGSYWLRLPNETP